MFYIANHQKKSISPLDKDQYLELFSSIKALGLRMLRAEDSPILKGAFMHLTNPHAKGEIPSGIRVIDLLSYSLDSLVKMNIKGGTRKNLQTLIDNVTKEYGVSCLPFRDETDDMAQYFYITGLDDLIDPKLLISWIGLPTRFNVGVVQYINQLKELDTTLYQPGDLNIAITGALARFGLRQFPDSYEQGKGYFWAGWERTGDDKTDKENQLKLAVLPDTFDPIGAKKLGMVTYFQPLLTNPA